MSSISKDIWDMKRWALLVGVNYYQDELIHNLNYAANDAKEIHNWLISRREHGYDQERTCLLISEGREFAEATQRSIFRELRRLANETNEKDLLLFYFSGHAILHNGEVYLVPSDIESDLLPYTSIPLRSIKEIMQEARAGQKVIVLDACYAGVKLKGKSVTQYSQEFIERVFENAAGIAVLASSSQEEPTLEGDHNMRHGVFTYYLLEVLKGKDKKDSDPFITLRRIVDYVKPKVEVWTASPHKMKMTPTLDFQGSGEFVLLTLPQPGLEIPGLHTPTTATETKRPHPFETPYQLSVRDPQEFFARGKELEKVREMLTRTRNLAVVVKGELGIGVTSFFNRIQQLLKEGVSLPQNIYCFSINPDGIQSCEEFARNILRGLQDCFPGAKINSDIIVPFTFNGFAAQLMPVWEQLPADIMIIVLIDRFDKLVYRREKLQHRRIRGLLHDLVETRDFPLLFIISTLQELPSSYGSSVPVEIVPLKPFSYSETDEMLTRILDGYADAEEEVLAWFYQYTGGYPYLIKVMLASLFDMYIDKGTKKITLAMLSEAAQTAIEDSHPGRILRDIYEKYLSEPERYVLLWLASKRENLLTAGEVASVGVKRRTAVRQLAERAYITPQKDGSYRMVGFLYDWFRSWIAFEAELERLGIDGHMPSLSNVKVGQELKLPVEIIPHGVCIDLTTRLVYVAGEKIDDLGDVDYRALVYLAKRVGQIVSYDELANHLYPSEHYEGDNQRLYQIRSRLGSALDDKERPHKYLETLRGRGLRLKNTRFVRTSTQPPTDIEGKYHGSDEN